MLMKIRGNFPYLQNKRIENNFFTIKIENTDGIKQKKTKNEIRINGK